MIALTADNMCVLAARVTQLEDDLRSAESHAAMLLSQLARTEHERDEARANTARLRDALEEAEAEYCEGHLGNAKIATRTALAETPAASLEAITGPLNARIAELEAAWGRALDLNNKQYEDSNIAHRWFAAHFGELMNGRDFAVKCPMATEALKAIRAEAALSTLDEGVRIATEEEHRLDREGCITIACGAQIVARALSKRRDEIAKEGK